MYVTILRSIWVMWTQFGLLHIVFVRNPILSLGRLLHYNISSCKEELVKTIGESVGKWGGTL